MNAKTMKILSVLAIVALAFAALAVVIPAEQNDAEETGTAWYLDPTAATGGDGSKDSPFNTIDAALEVCVAGDRIVLLEDAGTSGTPVAWSITKAVTLCGESSSDKPTIIGVVTFGITGAMEGTFGLENLIIKATGAIGIPQDDGTPSAPGSVIGGDKLEVKIVDVDFIKEFVFNETASEKKSQLLGFYQISGQITVDGCTFTENKVGTSVNTAQRCEAILAGYNNSSSAAKLTVTDCVFNGFAKPIQTCGLDTLIVTDNEVESWLNLTESTSTYAKNGARFFVQITAANAVTLLQVMDNEFDVKPSQIVIDDAKKGLGIVNIQEDSTVAFKAIESDMDVNFEKAEDILFADGADIRLYAGLTLDGETTVSALSLPTNGAILTIDSPGKTITITDLTLPANGVILLKAGTLDLAGDTDFTCSGKILVMGGTLITYAATPSEDLDPITNVTYLSGHVKNASAAGATGTAIKENTKKYTVGSSKITAATPEIAAAALDEGIKEVTIGADIDMATLARDLVIGEGQTLIVSDNKAITISADYKFVCNGGTFKGVVKADADNYVTVDNLKGTFTFSKGSLVIDATTIVSGEITPTGTVVITGTLTGDLRINDGTTATVYFTNYTIAPTGKLILGANTYLAADEDGAATSFNMYGTITSTDTTTAAGARTITVQGSATDKTKSTFTAYTGAKLSEYVEVEGNGNYYSIDLSGAMKVLEINTDITASKTFGQLEAVVVIESLTISNGAVVKILGSFTVAAGVTVTVEDGAQLIVDSTAATVDLTGKLVIESDGTMDVKDASSVSISGSLVSEGTVKIAAPTTVKKGGSIDIRDDADGTKITKGLTVAAGGYVKLSSEVTLSDVTNKGEIVLQDMVMQAATKISMAASEAMVDIESVSGAFALTITDAGMSFAKGKVVTPNTVVMDSVNSTVKGLVISEYIVSYDYEGTTYYENHMILSGSITSVNADGEAVAQTVKTTGQWVDVTTALALGKNITLDVGGELTVSGILTAILDGSKITGTAGTTQIYAYGAITTITAITGTAANDIVNAAVFTTVEDAVTYYNYTPLIVALESDADVVNVYGTVYVDSTYTIVKDEVVKINAGAEVIIGENDSDAVITVEDGASIKGTGSITVSGTLAYENKKDSKVLTYSDVYVEDETSCMYTNIYTALATADDGDTITLSKSTTLKNSITIKNGVKLYVPASYFLTLNDGVTLTVNGTLETVEVVKAETAFGEKASTISNTSAIVVNGVFTSLSPIEYYDLVSDVKYMISGAYYSVSGYNYVAPLETAAASKAKDVEVWGDVTAGDVTFAGTSSSVRSLTVAPLSELKVNSLTLNYATFEVGATFLAPALFTGDVVVGDATLTANKVSALDIACSDKGTSMMLVNYAYIDADDEDAALCAATGQIAVDTITGEFIIAEGAEIVVPASTAAMYLDDTIVYGTLTVGSGMSATIDGCLIVLGTVTVASETDTTSAGYLDVNGEIFLGINPEDELIGANAVLSGPMTYYALFAMAGSTVGEETVYDMLYTEFYVGLSVWMTAYVPATSSDYIIGEIEYEDDVGIFSEWLLPDGTSAGDAKIGASGYEAVYAEIQYDIYSVFIYTDAGVKSVSIDGIELYNAGNNLFQLPAGVKLIAGTHTVTYTMKAGYSGTPTLKTIDGTLLKDYKFITAGIEADDLTVSLQLNGTEPTPEPEPTPTPEEKSEWTITTILLCILVVLIAIMAVIVALRLNRN
jgi:hypothetical protein